MLELHLVSALGAIRDDIPSRRVRHISFVTAAHAYAVASPSSIEPVFVLVPWIFNILSVVSFLIYIIARFKHKKAKGYDSENLGPTSS